MTTCITVPESVASLHATTLKLLLLSVCPGLWWLVTVPDTSSLRVEVWVGSRIEERTPLGLVRGPHILQLDL